MKTFLKTLRKSQDISQEFLANEIGISRPTYLQIEKGNREITVSEARKIAEFFGRMGCEERLD